MFKNFRTRLSSAFPANCVRLAAMGQKGSHLKLTDMYQLRNETYFTENEIREFYKEFVKTHPNGKMNEEDLHRLYKSIFSQGDPSCLVSQLFRLYDTDKNGHIDFREFLCVVSVLSNGSKNSKLKLAFSLYDQDDSGFISRDEYQAIMSAVHKAMGTLTMGEGDSQQVQFERLDSNSDNKVSFEEFENYAKRDPKLIGLMTITVDV